MPRILAIDCGTHAGLTYEAATDVPHPTVFDMGSGIGKSDVGIGYGRPFSRFRRHLVDCIQATATELVCYEAPLPVGGGSRGFQLQQSTIRILYGLPAIIEEVCYSLDVECAEVNVMAVKKHLTGSGHSEKKDVLAAVNRILGLDIRNHNAADSAALWAYAKALRQPAWAPRATPLFGERR